MNAAMVIRELRRYADRKHAVLLSRYFKTDKGEYGEGDVFIGLTVPKIRSVAVLHRELPLPEIERLLKHKVHEYRLTALIILTNQFKKADEKHKKIIYDFYLSHTAYINNWDLVDLSSHEIVGVWLYSHPEERQILFSLAQSKNLWEKRIAMISTFAFLRRGQWHDTIAIADMLLHDSHDLIHKAVGWGLREVGKRNLAAEEKFLKKNCTVMPRTMLRYAIEKFPEFKRQMYLSK